MADSKITGNSFSGATPTIQRYSSFTQVDHRGLPKPQFIASNESGTGFISYSADAKPKHLIAKENPPSFLDRVFGSCTKPSLLKGWGESLAMFSDWALGRGDVKRTFTQCSPQVQNMADAYGVGKARDLIYEKNSGLPYEEWTPVRNFRASFGVSGLFSAGIDPTEQFVGSYRVEIFPQENKILRFEVTNITSMESFLYGAGPAYERSGLGYGGNMGQEYIWEEPLR
jgi:hypothetical protein